MVDWLLTHTPLFYLVQSLWRDEAFSWLTAQKPIAEFIGTLNFEPPLYYVLLHIWIRIFGTSEIALRSLSLVGFCLATTVVVFWSEKRFGTHWLSWAFPLLFFLNPMLLYYAFEVRAYGWFMFFSTLSIYYYGSKNYRFAALANVLTFYTHSYGIIIPFVQCLHYVFTHKKNMKELLPFGKIQVLTGLAILPWFFPLYEEAKKMRPTWYFPVDFQLIKSVLGNLFTGYDGTPGGLWNRTFLLSGILILLFLLAYQYKKERNEISYLLSMVFIPLLLVVSISFFKPLFVNRYLIYVTISQMFLVGYAIFHLTNPLAQKLMYVTILVFMLSINSFFPQKKAKFDIRTLVGEANAIQKTDDLIYVTDPLIFFETVYYAKNPKSVYLYNPNRGDFPWYVGETAFSPSQMAFDLPEYPNRAVLVSPNNSLTIQYEMSSVQKK